MKRCTALLLFSGFIACYSMSLAQSQLHSRGKRWVSTWTAAAAQSTKPSTGERGASVASRGGMATPYTALHSPEVHPDRTVTLRFLAPNATQVEVVGEIREAKARWL